MPRFMDYMVSPPVHGSLEVRWPAAQRAEIFYIPSRRAVAVLRDASIPNRMKLLDIDRSKRRLTIHPINTRWKIDTFLKPKYAQIRKLTLAGHQFVDLPINDASSPSDEDEVMMLLEDLPDSFIKDFEYGLGFVQEYRCLIRVVEALSDASELQISDNCDTGEVEGHDVFHISSDDFDAIRKTINRINNNGRTAMATVKTAMIHNFLADKVGHDPVEVSFGRGPLRKGFTEVAIDGEASLAKSQQSELINTVSKHVKTIVEDQPEKMFRLQKDFELIKLEHLIQHFEQMMTRSHQESVWQAFLNENRFLLGMTFGYPAIIVDDEVSVGGYKFSGSGGTSTDYLMKNQITDNVAIIEIKKPSTPLLYNTHYREGVFSASRELSGAINQVLDQKHTLLTNFAVMRMNSRNYEIESYAVSCCLIIGRMPQDDDERKSFEFIRRNSRDVEIITFDEMLMKLKNFKTFLSGEKNRERFGSGGDRSAVLIPYVAVFFHQELPLNRSRKLVAAETRTIGVRNTIFTLLLKTSDADKPDAPSSRYSSPDKHSQSQTSRTTRPAPDRRKCSSSDYPLASDAWP